MIRPGSRQSAALGLGIFRTKIGYLAISVVQDGRPALTFVGALRIGVPVAAAQCVGLIAGNTATGPQAELLRAVALT